MTLRTLLPQVSTEDLNQTDLKGGDLAMHKDTSQIKLDLETDIYVGTVDSWTPPERESTIGNLIQTGPLCVREFLVSHRLLETRRLLPEQTLPGREISALEKSVLQNTFNTTKGGNDIDTVIVKLPQFSVVALGCPPEWITRVLVSTFLGNQRPRRLTVSATGTVSSRYAHANHGHTPRCVDLSGTVC